ncbi:alpha/beta fold hydrolase [Novispirillum sp. DQ9]|uniref:alpha/beta fold hydrolase n=1 Tax=Novispirillum sp. DQ9 TaxID=3398612 RepID=UPI003C7EB8CE
MERQPLVLVPGLLTDHALWARQTARLTDVADIVVADVGQDDSLGAMADRLLAAAPERFALAGLSMGGYVVQEVMRRAPDRVSRLALLDTNARADLPEQKKMRQDLMDLAAAGRFAEVPPAILPNLVHEDRVTDERFMGMLTDMALRVGADAFIRQQRAIMERPDGRDDLARITVPTLVLCGREDKLTPPKVHQEMADRLPNGALVVLDDCGHMAPLEQPAAVNAVFRYWLQM